MSDIKFDILHSLVLLIALDKFLLVLVNGFLVQVSTKVLHSFSLLVLVEQVSFEFEESLWLVVLELVSCSVVLSLLVLRWLVAVAELGTVPLDMVVLVVVEDGVSVVVLPAVELVLLVVDELGLVVVLF